MIRRKIKITAEERQSPEWPYSPQETKIEYQDLVHGLQLGSFIEKRKNAKHLLTGLTSHKLTGRKEVVQMLNKLNSCSSCNEIGLQNRSWACMVPYSKHMTNHMCKGIPVHATIDNNDGVQETLTGKGMTRI